MSKRIERPGDAAIELLQQAIREWHPELSKAGARIALLMVWPPVDVDGRPTGPAIKQAGFAAVGRASLARPRERLLVGCDAVVEVDAEAWEGLLDDGRLALLDHELEHIVVVVKDGEIARYADGHPQLKLRPDDWMLTGFASVVRRHGRQAIEVTALRRVHEACQELFEFMVDEQKPQRGRRKAG